MTVKYIKEAAIQRRVDKMYYRQQNNALKCLTVLSVPRLQLTGGQPEIVPNNRYRSR